MKNKIKILVLIIMLTAVVFLLSGCQNKEENNIKSENNAENSVSIRDALIGQTNIATNTTGTTIESLKEYNKESDDNYITYTLENGTSFMYPKTWVSVGTETEPAFMGTDGRGASVNIAHDSLDDGSSITADFDTYMEFQKIYLKQQMTLLTDITEKNINLNGKEAYVFNYVTETQQNETTIQLNVTQVAFEQDGDIEILTLAVINDFYDDLQPTFEKMIKSFTK